MLLLCYLAFAPISSLSALINNSLLFSHLNLGLHTFLLFSSFKNPQLLDPFWSSAPVTSNIACTNSDCQVTVAPEISVIVLRSYLLYCHSSSSSLPWLYVTTVISTMFLISFISFLPLLSINFLSLSCVHPIAVPLPIS